MPHYEEQLITLLNDHQQRSPATETALLQKIAALVNELIQHDFPKLVQILYRADISEKKLKENIAQAGNDDTAQIIARMLLERQQQKSALRQSFTSSQESIPDEEKW